MHALPFSGASLPFLLSIGEGPALTNVVAFAIGTIAEALVQQHNEPSERSDSDGQNDEVEELILVHSRWPQPLPSDRSLHPDRPQHHDHRGTRHHAPDAGEHTPKLQPRF